METTKKRILITNPTGKTSYIATRQLLADGYSVRILTCNRNGRATELVKHGTELCLDNLTSYTGLTRALQGIQRVYCCYLFLPDLTGSAISLDRLTTQLTTDPAYISVRDYVKTQTAG